MLAPREGFLVDLGVMWWHFGAWMVPETLPGCTLAGILVAGWGAWGLRWSPGREGTLRMVTPQRWGARGGSRGQPKGFLSWGFQARRIQNLNAWRLRSFKTVRLKARRIEGFIFELRPEKAEKIEKINLRLKAWKIERFITEVLWLDKMFFHSLVARGAGGYVYIKHN